MSIDLSTKKVIITGSTDGLGKLTALNLAKLKSHLTLHGRSAEKLETLKNECLAAGASGVDTICCDLTNTQETIKQLASVSTADILINCPGVWAEGPLTGHTPEKIIEMVQVNLLSYLLSCRLLLPLLEKSEYGQILNVISVAGIEIPVGYSHTVYTATKYALQGFSEGLEKELTNQNVRVMAIYPGGMNTGIFKKAGLDYSDNEPWMFDTQETVDAMIFMLTRNPKVNIKRLDLVNHFIGD